MDNVTSVNLPYDNILWPCQISKDLRKELGLVARLKVGVESIPSTRSSQPPQGIYYVHRGVLSLGIINELNDNEVNALFSKGDWLFPEYFLSPRSIFLTSHEIEDVELIYFSFKSLKNIASRHTQIYELLLFMTSKNHAAIFKDLSNLLLPKEVRVSISLVDLYNRVRDNNENFDDTINISQNRLSFLVSLSRPKLNIELKNLELNGAISLSRGKIKILDIHKLTNRLDHDYL